MKSVMAHNFSQVPTADIQRSSFVRSSGYKTTIDGGTLYPFFCDEVLPGDTFNLSTHGFCRMATPLYPVMDNLFMDTHFFFVPNRLVWDNWEKMMGAQINPGDSTDFLIPQVTAPVGGFPEGSIYDYFGIPTKIDNLSVNALPLRAYALIYNDWFRDQNLQSSQPVPTDDGPDPDTGNVLKRRGKRHDYFTSCLPWPQKGDSVDIPIGTTAPILPGGQTSLDADAYFQGENGFYGNLQAGAAGADVSADINTGNINDQWQAGEFIYPALVADLSNATAATINQLRQAFQVQKMYERDARGGTRYIEVIKAHFNVSSPDARLQRPEYLGGGSTPINIHQVAQTSNIDSVGGDGTVGQLGAYGTAGGRQGGFTKSFTEHGFIIGVVSVRADLTYQQGLNKMWSRRDRFDHYFPALAHLGEQAVLNKEIYAQGTDQDDDVFGYQERFAEYRYKPSLITGQFRSNAATPLDAWHLSQDFDNLPVLDNAFITERPPIDRVVATPDEPNFICDFYHQLITARPMPINGIPGYIDRF
ncbi:major capsid protein [Microviridae sp.]|nr:major capsid protein [Microviridae sp.]